MSDIIEFLNRPVQPSSAANRVSTFLGNSEEYAFMAMTFGELIYDRISIDSSALDAFDFIHPVNQEGMYALATWADAIIGKSPQGYEGSINQLQGYVFERMAALSLRHSGAVVQFPESTNNPGWDLMVNGQEVQAKCGLSPDLVTEHLQKYPYIPRVIVNEDLAGHFSNNDYITVVHGVSRDAVRSATEHSLHSAADMLDLHLGTTFSVVLCAKYTYHLLKRDTDWSALRGVAIIDGSTRVAGLGAAHLATHSILALGLVGGWPAILMPIAASMVGLRSGRTISDIAKRHVLLRIEFTALTKALSEWCQGTARVLADMIRQAEKPILRIAKYDNVHNDYVALFNDWRARLEAEQNYRRFYLDKFIRASSEPWVFDSGSGPLEACILAMITAAKAGILPADLVAERNLLMTCINNYTIGLKRRLLFH